MVLKTRELLFRVLPVGSLSSAIIKSNDTRAQLTVRTRKVFWLMQ